MRNLTKIRFVAVFGEKSVVAVMPLGQQQGRFGREFRETGRFRSRQGFNYQPQTQVLRLQRVAFRREADIFGAAELVNACELSIDSFSAKRILLIMLILSILSLFGRSPKMDSTRKIHPEV